MDIEEITPIVKIRKGDSASKRSNYILSLFLNNESNDFKVTITNQEQSFQKLFSIVELTKSKLKEKDLKIYQYNRLEYLYCSCDNLCKHKIRQKRKFSEIGQENTIIPSVNDNSEVEISATNNDIYPNVTVVLSIKLRTELTAENGWSCQ